MSIECRYIQCLRSSGAQCIYTTIGLIYSNYAIMTKYLRMHTPQVIIKSTIIRLIGGSDNKYVRNRRGGVPPPDGLGDPTPTGSTFPCASVASLRPCVKYSFHLQSCESFNPEHPDSDNPHIALRWSAVLGPIALL